MSADRTLPIAGRGAPIAASGIEGVWKRADRIFPVCGTTFGASPAMTLCRVPAGRD